jgi:hypothetical protein
MRILLPLRETEEGRARKKVANSIAALDVQDDGEIVALADKDGSSFSGTTLDLNHRNSHPAVLISSARFDQTHRV